MSHIDPPSPTGFGETGPPLPEASARRAEDDPLHNPDVAYEHSDVSVQPLLMAAVGLVAGTGVIFVLMAWTFGIMESRAAASDPTLSPLARPATQMPKTTTGSPYFGNAPGPQLLVEEPAALRKERGIEDEKLQTYGWVDEKARTARMPISEAKKLLLERGLPVRADAAPDPSLGTRFPATGESSGGRTLTRRKEEAVKEEGTQAPAAPHKGPGQ
jgi:hypothetical protein